MPTEITVRVPPSFAPYVAIPDSTHRVKLAFHIDFDNGGFLSGEGFLLDLSGPAVTHARAAELLVSSMRLARVAHVTLRSLEIVRRGEHDDAP